MCSPDLALIASYHLITNFSTVCFVLFLTQKINTFMVRITMYLWYIEKNIMYRTVETSAVDLAAHRNVLSAPSLWDQTQCNAVTCMLYIFYWSLKSTNPYKSLVLHMFATSTVESSGPNTHVCGLWVETRFDLRVLILTRAVNNFVIVLFV